MGDAYEAFVIARRAENVTARTLDFYADKLLPFITWCTDVRHLATVDAITAAHVRAYLLSLQGRSLAPWTVHGAARAVKAFLRFCAEEGLVVEAPAFKMPRLPKTILPAFTAAEVARLLDACGEDRDRLIVYVLLDSGLRAAELCALDAGDVDERSGAVLVRQGKGRKDRTVYFGAKTRRELGRYWREHGRPAPAQPVFVSLTTGQRLTENGLRQMLHRIGDRAGVAHCHPHTFRRTFALWSLRAGMSIVHLQRLLGHEDLTVLRQYLALVNADMQAAHQAAGPVDRMLK